MSSRCPICNSTDTQKIRDKVRKQVELNVYRCAPCWLDFLESWDDEERVKNFYDQGHYVFRPNVTGTYQKFNEYDARVKRILPFVNRQTRLFEVGCGEGAFLRRIVPHVAQATGCDIVAAQVEQVRREGFDVHHCRLEDLTMDQPYDVICMFALLEHIPNVSIFLEHVKRFMHSQSLLFIEVPNLLNPLVSYYDIPEFRDFYYREYHLYYFTPKSLGLLMEQAGFAFIIDLACQGSLTNHFHWMHQRKGQPSTNYMVNVTLPVGMLKNDLPLGGQLTDILERLDDLYRDLLMQKGVSDLLACRAWLRP